MTWTSPMNGPCSTMYIAPRHIIVAASDRAECTALRSATMPMPPASAMGPRIQNATASPSGTCPFINGAAALTMVAAYLYRVAGDGLAGGVGRALRRAQRLRLLGLNDVVVLLVVAEAHRMRRRLHAGQQRGHQLLLGVDELLAIVECQLVLVAHRERTGRARLDAQAAENAAQVVDLIDLAVALTGRIPLRLGVVTALDVDRVGRAGPGAQLAADALLQAVRVPVEHVPAVVARGGRVDVERVLLRVDLLEHGREGQPEPLGEAEDAAGRLRLRRLGRRGPRGRARRTRRRAGRRARSGARVRPVSHRRHSPSDRGRRRALKPAPASEPGVPADPSAGSGTRGRGGTRPPPRPPEPPCVWRMRSPTR